MPITNPYAPPIDDTLPQAKATASEGDYYAITPLKMVLLSLASFGIFELYWFYRQWKAVRARNGLNVSPFWRAVFNFWFCNRLFGHIRCDTEDAGVRARTSTGVLATTFIVLSVVGRVLAQADKGHLWFVGLATIVPLAIVQQEINEYLTRVSPDLNRNESWGAGNIATLILGVVLWGLVLLGPLVAAR